MKDTSQVSKKKRTLSPAARVDYDVDESCFAVQCPTFDWHVRNATTITSPTGQQRKNTAAALFEV